MNYSIAGIRIKLPDAFVEGHFARALAPFEVQGAGGNDTALIVAPGSVIPEQADYRELSFFDFPDADADCRFGRDGAGWLFVMTPRSDGAPVSFRKEYDTPTAITDFTPEHNPALFRFGIWMLFNIAAAPRHAVAVHSSVIACNGFGVLFLGESGTGKSTHTRLWRENISGATLLNDDSPIVCISDRTAAEDAETPSHDPSGKTVVGDGRGDGNFPADSAAREAHSGNIAAERFQALVSGSAWSGKTPCYKNIVLPIRAIVRLSQAPENRIRRLAPIEAIGALLPSCPPAFAHDETLQDAVCATISAVLSRVPAYHLACRPDAAAAQLACNTIFGKEELRPNGVQAASGAQQNGPATASGHRNAAQPDANEDRNDTRSGIHVFPSNNDR